MSTTPGPADPAHPLRVATYNVNGHIEVDLSDQPHDLSGLQPR